MGALLTALRVRAVESDSDLWFDFLRMLEEEAHAVDYTGRYVNLVDGEPAASLSLRTILFCLEPGIVATSVSRTLGLRAET